MSSQVWWSKLTYLCTLVMDISYGIEYTILKKIHTNKATNLRKSSHPGVRKVPKILTEVRGKLKLAIFVRYNISS